MIERKKSEIWDTINIGAGLGALMALLVAFFIMPAKGAQNELVPPTAGIYTGVQYSQKIGDAFRSLASCNKGPAAPANVGGAAVDGLCWIDDSTTPWIVKQYVNGGWAVTGALDPTTSAAIGAIGGGLATISAAATTDLGSVPQANVTISGAATITSFGSSAPAGIEKTIRFDNASVLSPSNAMLVPGGYPLTTAAQDRAKVTHLGSGNWEVTQYTRANGIPVDLSKVGKPSYDFSVSVSPLEVAGYGQSLSRATYPAYFAKTTRTQNGTRTAGNATITGIGNTSGLGLNMPVESTGVTPGCIIASVTSNSITLNSSSCVTSSGTSALLVLPYGYGTGGNYALDAGVPDCRNRMLAGRDRSDPGSLAGLLTSSYFGADSSVFGKRGGDEKQTLALSQLPTGITSSGSNVIVVYVLGSPTAANVPYQTGVGGIGDAFINSAGSLHVPWSSSVGGWQGVNQFSNPSQVISATSNNTSGLAHPIVPPTLVADCVVRVTP